MTQRLKAIPTTYHGIEFRSKLEAKYARAFDRLGIMWEYEGHGFQFDDGTFYCPDFYMPELDTYFEVKGVMNHDSARKIGALANEHGAVYVGKPDGAVSLFERDDGQYIDALSEIERAAGCRVSGAEVVRCAGCGSAYLSWDIWRGDCPKCGNDGEYYEGEYANLFEAAGWECGR